ncbi:MAG: minichromosome maintenance protein MCM [Candidatus Aenigmarchaeota archaeon]|nr:minichromosome maintenance protein MCM [Candidatus Aenigmarchaeota archaeon]
MSSEEITTKIYEFLYENCSTDIYKAVNGESALVVDFAVFDRYDPITGEMLLENPDEIMESFREAAKRIGEAPVNVRIKNLPDRRNIRIRNLRAKHMGKLWCVDAVIKSATEVKPQIYEVIFECPDCHAKMTVKQESSIVQKPAMCGPPYTESGCGRRGDFDAVAKKMYDVRWLTGVEPFEVTEGEQPGEIAVVIKEDLTTPRMQKMTDPGNRLKIVGILKEVPKRIKGKLSTKMDMMLEAVHLEFSETEFEDMEITPEDEQVIKEMAADPNIYDKLVASVAPGIYGFKEIKEAIVMQLFGGVPHVLADGSRVRGNVHILLTGDPGVGKSMLLKFVSDLMPRGRYVSGSGATGAGLTASVRKDEIMGGWLLEAGALILANKSVIAIDEFDKMSRDDQIAMHEAMSIESVSIAKASIVATLPAQTAVLAGANPKLSRFDRYTPIIEQIQIPETLLSRFDLKFALLDRPDRNVDERLAEHIAMSRITPEMVEPAISHKLLKKYIAYAKQKITSVELTKDSSDTLKAFYVEMRNPGGAGENAPVGITLRQYEALLRLAEASAKIRLSDKMSAQDAERSIKLMKYSLSQLGWDYESGKFDIDLTESGVSSTKRRKIHVIADIIDSLQKKMKDIPVEDVKAAAEEQGVANAEEIIDKMKADGSLFEVRHGFIKKV